MTDKTGGAAFPVPAPTIQNCDWVYADSGMTLRDYFAAAALTGLCGKPLHTKKDIDALPSVAYSLADAMLAERDK